MYWYITRAVLYLLSLNLVHLLKQVTVAKGSFFFNPIVNHTKLTPSTLLQVLLLVCLSAFEYLWKVVLVVEVCVARNSVIIYQFCNTDLLRYHGFVLILSSVIL